MLYEKIKQCIHTNLGLLECLHFDLLLNKQHTQLHLSSAIFDILKEKTCPWRGAKTTEIWVWLMFTWTDEQTLHLSLSLNYQGSFSHNSLLSWYLQQRENEKVPSLLQHSVNTTGCQTMDTHSQVKSAATNL